MNGFFAWIVMGLIAGVLGKFLMPGRDSGGLIMTILLGVLGAMLGGWLGTKAGVGSVHDFSLQSIGLATCGSIVLLMIRRMMSR